MFHVEHPAELERHHPPASSPHSDHESSSGVHDRLIKLAMQMEQNHDSKDNRRKQNLNDMIVEDLLVGIGGIEEIGFFLARSFVRWGTVGQRCFF